MTGQANPSESSTTTAGLRLLAALTSQQVQTLLGLAAQHGLLADLDENLRVADPDLADTVRRFLAAETSTQPAIAPSDQKALEVWDGLWGDWESHISELGNAEGEYANHEEHWHPPYFDSTALTDDLENVAGQMLEWLERAFPLVNEPGLFRASVGEIQEGINSFPDWMQPFEDCCVLGPQATTCVLRWTWLGLAHESSPGPQLADTIHSLENKLKQVGLDTDACVQFFGQLPDTVAREILAHLGSEDYGQAVADLRSIWHRIRHTYEKRFDPTAHLRTCAEHLAEDWRYGEPLIADALARGDLAGAERFVEATLSSLLRLPPEEPWRPELGLVPEKRYYRSPEEDQAIPKLLEQWETIAGQRGRAKRAAVCRLQRALLDHPDDWPAVLEAFAAFRRDAGAPAVAEELFAQWRERTVVACADHDEPNRKPADSWVYWLIEARRDPSAHQARFLQHVNAWLGACARSAAFFDQHWRSLALLTRSLPQAARIQQQSPTFDSHVLRPALTVASKLSESLHEALACLGDDAARLDPMGIWRAHLPTLVPKPGDVGGSYYREQALWMKALSEVNRVGYDQLLAQWKVEHRRRRNLWAEMATARCPGI